MKIITDVRFVERTVPVSADTVKTVRILQRKVGDVYWNPITGELCCRHDEFPWEDVPMATGL